MQDYLGTRPQLERGALGSVVIAGGVKMKLVAIWCCGNRSIAEGASEDKLAHMSICWMGTQGVSRDCLPVAMDDRVGWSKRAMGEGGGWRCGGGGGGGSTEVEIVVVVVIVVELVQSRLLTTKSDTTNSGYNEAKKLIPAKILLYMDRNVSVIANSGYNEIPVIANWFCYPQWATMPLVTNQPLITNHMFGPC